MTTAAIVQARMGSTRLPGKVMLPLGRWTVLEEVLDRCAAIPGVDRVVCAVPDGPESDPVAALAAAAGATVHRGPEQDVLARYLGAAQAVGAHVVLRVTSDCPFLDPIIAGRVLSLRAEMAADYCANNIVPGYPHGLDCEAFSAVALAQAATRTNLPYDREHVTPWLRRTPQLRRASLKAPDASHAQERWTLDHPEDYAFVQAVVAAAGDRPWRNMAEILAILDEHPELRAINALHRSPRPTPEPPTGQESSHG